MSSQDIEECRAVVDVALECDITPFDTLPMYGKAVLLRVLHAAGYTANVRVVQRALFEVRQEWSCEHRRIYRPWVSAPGEFLIVDWGDVWTVSTAAVERKLLCFCAVLGWSRCVACN